MEGLVAEGEIFLSEGAVEAFEGGEEGGDFPGLAIVSVE